MLEFRVGRSSRPGRRGVAVIVAWFSLVVGVLGLTGLLWQVWVDQQRRRKEATLRFLIDIRPKWLELRLALDRQFGSSDPLTKTQVETEVAAAEDLHELIRELLTLIEYLAVGVNTRVFDINILSRASGGYLIGIFERLHEFILWRRLDDNELLAVEFEMLVDELRKRQREGPDPRRGMMRFVPWLFRRRPPGSPHV